MKKMYLIVLCLLVGIVGSNAQSMQVSGKVSDDTGSPVIGASVVVKGTTIGVTTGLDGSFSLTAPNSNSIIEFSYVGLETVEMAAQSTMNVTLKSDTVIVPDIVVTGMTSMDRRIFSGATDRLSADDIRLDGMADISRGLEGRSAGVSVQNVSGTFGTAPKIRIRGATSILGDSKPLWVVDGVILEDVAEVDANQLSSGDAVTMISSAVAGLNADDIENYQILKDGSATSVYGARAMAGVIVVTTKRGRSGVTSVNYTGEFSMRLKPSYSTYNIMNSQDQMSIYQELRDKGFLNFGTTATARNSGVYGKMYNLQRTWNPLTNSFMVGRDTADENAYLRIAEHRNTDWFDEMFRTNVSMTHSVSISGGTDKMASYMSLSMMNDPGWYIQSKVQRYTLNANSTYKFRDNLNITLLGSASYRKQRAPGSLSQQTDAVTGEVSRDFDINPFSYSMNTSRTLDPNEYYTMNYAPFNIFHELDNNYLDMNVIDAKFQAELKWTVVPGLNLSALGSLRYSSTNQKHHIKDSSNQANSYRAGVTGVPNATIRDANQLLYTDPDIVGSLPVTVLPEGGMLRKYSYDALSYNFRASVSWNKTFNEIHLLDLNGAFDIDQTKRSRDNFTGMGLLYSQGQIPFFNYLAFKQDNEMNRSYYEVANTLTRNVAFVTNGTYSYKAKYNLTGTFRYEGTNRMGKSNNARWLPTWNISASWNAHEEGFFQKFTPALSHFTPRISYSLTADAGPAWVTNSTTIIKSNTPWRPNANNREPGLEITQLANKDLTYEKKNEFNVGFDAGFLNNRLNLNFDIYWRKNHDLIGLTSTQGVGGEIQKYGNMANMRSRGVEFTIASDNIKKKDFSWNTVFTFSYTKSTVTKLSSYANVMSLVLGSGFSMKGFGHNSIFSIPFTGLDEFGLPKFTWGVEGTEVGRNNYGVINLQERGDQLKDWLVYEGPAEPKYTGGLGNTFTYKNWRLNVFMTYSFGNKIRLDPVFNSSYSDMDAMPKEFKNRWMMMGDNKYTDIPKIASLREVRNVSYLNTAYNAYNYSTARIADGGFVRMKEISLTYDFPKNMVKNWGLGALSLKLQATNPFLIYADKDLNGSDPEFFQAGGVSSPIAKQFTMTVRIGF